MAFQSMTGYLASLIIAFITNWKLALVILAFTPLMLISGYINKRVMDFAGGVARKKLSEGAKVKHAQRSLY